MLVADEDVVRLGPAAPAFLWLVDITDEMRPILFVSFQVDEEDGSLNQTTLGYISSAKIFEALKFPLPRAWTH